MRDSHVDRTGLVPTMMKRIIDSPSVRPEDWTGLRILYRTAAACPSWLKRRWIDIVDPEHIVELYGSTEATGYCLIDGVEWPERPGSVELPLNTTVKILDGNLEPVLVGTIGPLLLRSRAGGTQFVYLGAVGLRPRPGELDTGLRHFKPRHVTHTKEISHGHRPEFLSLRRLPARATCTPVG
jgi:acyl-CoA synthetase (AMP-forming)/AMP-acid ligase II